MTNETRNIGGVDSHKDTINVAVITEVGARDRQGVPHHHRRLSQGGRVADRARPAAGGRRRRHQQLRGRGVHHPLPGRRQGDRGEPDPSGRGRKQGKSDRLDAYRAARSVLSGEASTDPKRASIEPLRALTVTRRSAVKAQQAAWRQIGALLVNSSARLRDHYRDLPDSKLVAALADTRPSQVTDPRDADTLFALRSLARRHRDLTEEITVLEEWIQARATAANPALLAIKGVGAVVGAQLLIAAGDNPDRLRSSASFADLCGTAPIPFSSGRSDRRRLSRR